jgi:hypothetical protein
VLAALSVHLITGYFIRYILLPGKPAFIAIPKGRSALARSDEHGLFLARENVAAGWPANIGHLAVSGRAGLGGARRGEKRADADVRIAAQLAPSRNPVAPQQHRLVDWRRHDQPVEVSSRQAGILQP